MALIACGECGKQVSDKAAACPRCGAPVPRTPDAPPIMPYTPHPAGSAVAAAGTTVVRLQKSRGIAIVLAIFLGGLGFHRFYLGSVGWGLVYLIFCWTFIPSLVALVEALRYALMGEDAFHQQYG